MKLVILLVQVHCLSESTRTWQQHETLCHCTSGSGPATYGHARSSCLFKVAPLVSWTIQFSASSDWLVSPHRDELGKLNYHETYLNAFSEILTYLGLVSLYSGGRKVRTLMLSFNVKWCVVSKRYSLLYFTHTYFLNLCRAPPLPAPVHLHISSNPVTQVPFVISESTAGNCVQPHIRHFRRLAQIRMPFKMMLHCGDDHQYYNVRLSTGSSSK
jgi:hypothetical protein